uniref:Uncharacterized protein n=1 Tax=viral metagenome TaxID=1070528 RepID=A0A6M3J0C2_9ZZZZ
MKHRTLVDKFHVSKGTVVTSDDNESKGKTGMTLCSVGNGALFYKDSELEKI